MVQLSHPYMTTGTTIALTRWTFVGKVMSLLFNMLSAAAAAKSLQSDSVQPHRRQPTRLRHPWDSPGKTTGVGCHFLLQCMKVKEESEKVGLQLNIQKTKIMASGPITSWELDGETVETVPDFILRGSKITVDGDCSHEIERHLLLGKKVMSNLDSIFKSRDITLPTKVHLVKAMVFPVVMYGCESWTVKKAER